MKHKKKNVQNLQFLYFSFQAQVTLVVEQKVQFVGGLDSTIRNQETMEWIWLDWVNQAEVMEKYGEIKWELGLVPQAWNQLGIYHHSPSTTTTSTRISTVIDLPPQQPFRSGQMKKTTYFYP